MCSTIRLETTRYNIGVAHETIALGIKKLAYQLAGVHGRVPPSICGGAKMQKTPPTEKAPTSDCSSEEATIETFAEDSMHSNNVRPVTVRGVQRSITGDSTLSAHSEMRPLIVRRVQRSTTGDSTLSAQLDVEARTTRRLDL